MCLPSHSRRLKTGESWFKPACAKKQNPTSKITRAKRDRGIAQAIEHCLARVKPGVQTLVSPKKQQRKPKKTKKRALF
jgi:hypothetical protein